MIFTYRNAARSTSGLHFTTFWLSMLAALAATVIAGVHLAKDNRSRLAVLTAFGMYTYLPKFMMSVNGPVYYDEFGQWRHVDDILRTGNLLPASTYLPVLRDYPGLALMTALVHAATSLSTWHSGQVVVLASHCASLVLIFLLAGEVGLSSAGAFFAAVLFGLNPSFMYFDTQFAYESLGITLALFAVLCAYKSRRALSARSSWQWAALGACVATYCVVTHHISTAVMLLTVAAVALFVPPRTATMPNTRHAAQLSTWVLLAMTSAALAIWVGLVASPTIAYLSPYIREALAQVELLLRSGTSASSSGVLHVPFSGATSSSSPGGGEPGYERLAGYASPFVAFGALCSAAFALRRSPRETARTMLPFLLLALAYLVSLPFALTAGGGEAAHRSWSFTYIGVSIVAAVRRPACRELPPSLAGMAASFLRCDGMCRDCRALRRQHRLRGVGVVPLPRSLCLRL